MSERPAIHVGTAAWSISSRYLNEIPAGGSQLMRYAQMFSVVEIDSAFSRHHRAATYARWAQSVGENFRFAVKVPKALTHEGALLIGDNATRSRFLAEVAGLGPKLAVLLVQLPPKLAFDAALVRDFFADLHAAKPSAVAIACEPRHPSWATAAVDELLKDLHVSRVAADPPRWDTDALPGGDRRLAYFRLHGSPRTYFSDYEAARLQQLQRQLERAAGESQSVWCIFDNTAHGHAIGNALWTRRMLARPACA